MCCEIPYKGSFTAFFYSLEELSKNTARVPGPEWEPIVGPIWFTIISFISMFSLRWLYIYMASSSQSQWLIITMSFPWGDISDIVLLIRYKRDFFLPLTLSVSFNSPLLSTNNIGLILIMLPKTAALFESRYEGSADHQP